MYVVPSTHPVRSIQPAHYIANKLQVHIIGILSKSTITTLLPTEKHRSSTGANKPTAVGIVQDIQVYFPFFFEYQNTDYLLDITFIFDRCHHSIAVATPVKYECDSQDPRGTCENLELHIRAKLMKGGLVLQPQLWPAETAWLAHTKWKIIFIIKKDTATLWNFQHLVIITVYKK